MVPNLAAALVKQLEMAVYTADRHPLSLNFSTNFCRKSSGLATAPLYSNLKI